ncbi:MAG: ABC transporter ATP-binding protein [Pseudomonadota bacterium]
MIGPLLQVAGTASRTRLRRSLVGLIVEGVLTGLAFAMLVPILRALFAGDTATAWTWIAGLSMLFVCYTVVRWRTQLEGYGASIGLSRVLFRRLSNHIARLPLGWFSADKVGDIGRLCSQGVINVIGIPANLLRPVVVGLVTPATVMLAMFIFDWRLALAALISAPVLAVIFRWSADLVQRTDHSVNAAAAETTGRIVEFAQAQQVLRAFGTDQRGYADLDRALIDQHRAQRGQIFTVAPGLASFTLALQLVFTTLLILGVNLALGGQVDAAELVALMVLTVRYVEPLMMAADLAGALRVGRNSLDRMDALLTTPMLAESQSGQVPESGEIRFENVSFAYGDTPVLEKISFRARTDTTTAIVGPSGAGKTTILRLIARFWDADGGAIRIGGTNVRDVATRELMRHISVVFQDVYLFDGTIEENIRLGRPSASEADIARAARLAAVDEIAARLPGGLQARVGEGGSALSGGEAQRVSIARAILKDAPIILLDEATAALDPVNDAAIQTALAELSRDKTLVVVAHRLQTIQGADQILVLDGGRIAAQGTHDALLAGRGKYAEFWKQRSNAQGWRIAHSG